MTTETNLREVTQREFFAYVGPRDIVCSHIHPDRTLWETRDRRLVGVSYPGWKNPGGAERWLLISEAL